LPFILNTTQRRLTNLNSLAFAGISLYPLLDIHRSKRDAKVPLYIKDDTTAALVAELAKKQGVSKQDAVRMAVQAELARITQAVPLRERIAAWRKEHPMPLRTGQKADKSFFDDLSGEP
jgi:antitoxin VapB